MSIPFRATTALERQCPLPHAPASVRRFRVRVVAGLREPVFWVNSLLNEFAKSRLFHEGIVNLQELGKQMISRDIHFSARLQLWSGAFGRENVSVFTLNEGDDYLAHILKLFDIAPMGLVSPDNAWSNR